MKNKNNLMIGTIIVLVGIITFFAGMKYGQTVRTKSPNSVMGGQSQVGGRQGGGQSRANIAGRPVMGEILTIDSKSLTVKLQDGSSKIVMLPDSVTVSKTEAGSKENLKVGVQVGVFGTDNSDGSVTAANIQLNPMFRMGRGGFGGASQSGTQK